MSFFLISKLKSVDSHFRSPNEILPYPLDFVVHHINKAVHYQLSDDSEDEAVNEVNYELKKEGFEVHKQENGADFEFSETEPSETPKPSSSTTVPPKPAGHPKFRKGHRRAWSMPNAKDKAVLVVADDSVNVSNCLIFSLKHEN